jgi:flagellar assembly protein FliH
MLAKLIRGDVGGQFAPVEWPPLVCENSGVAFADTEPQPRDVVQLRSQIAALKSELSAAHAEAERRVNEALAVGRREANESTQQAFEQHLEDQLSKLRLMIREVAASGSKLRRQAEEDLVRLAVAIARRILHRELTIDPDALTGVVKAAFERLDQREIHQLRTDPDSVAVVRRVVEGLGLARALDVIPDPSLRPGSLVIETLRGQLDASIETQLNEIQRGFIDIVQHS